MDWREWLNKFAPSRIYWYGFTDEVKQKYPYIEVDFMAAWERRGYEGARDVLNYAEFIMAGEGVVVYHCYDEVSFGQLPDCIKEVSCKEVYETSCGYHRRSERGKYRLCADGFTTICKEVCWHIHDGYGEESGTVEFWAYI